MSTYWVEDICVVGFDETNDTIETHEKLDEAAAPGQKVDCLGPAPDIGEQCHELLGTGYLVPRGVRWHTRSDNKYSLICFEI